MGTIDADKPIFNIPATVNKAGPKTDKNCQFDRILHDTVQETKKNDNQSQSVNVASQIRPVQFLNDTKTASSSIVEEVSQLIDTLDVYQQKLSSESNTLKDIWPLVEKMGSQTESLRFSSKDMAAQDVLTNIVDQCILLTSTEIAKFNNGYYTGK